MAQNGHTCPNPLCLSDFLSYSSGHYPTPPQSVQTPCCLPITSAALPFDPFALLPLPETIPLLPSSAQSRLLNEGHNDFCICSYDAPPPQSLSFLFCSEFSYSVTPASLSYRIIYTFITCITYCSSSTLGSLLEFKLCKGTKFCFVHEYIPSVQNAVCMQ